MTREPLNSPTYPYHRDQTGANTLHGAEDIPYRLLTYLLDLPDGSGYVPIDDNERYPRCRFAKYLWYDGADPLSMPLPTPKEKLSLLFDPTNPVLNTDELKAAHPKGYRLIGQRVRGQSNVEAKTFVRCYLGRIYEPRKFLTTIGVRFDVFCDVNFESNTKTSAYQRSFDIEQCLHEALDGVNVTGIGTVSFSRADHGDNGSEFAYDEATYVGRRVNCSITWAEGGGTVVTPY